MDGNKDFDDGQEPYPPDPDEDDAPGMHVPQPVSKVVRARWYKERKPKRGQGPAKGGGRILVREKQRQALELRKGGATYAKIAEAVGYADAAGARKAVLRAYSDVIQEPVEELKTLQIERLNHMLLVLWPRVNQGDLGAINTSLSIMGKIDALKGTEAVRTLEVNTTNRTAVLVVDGNKEDYIANLKRMSGINPDGTNANGQVQQVAGTQELPQITGPMYPPGMGPVVQGQVLVDAVALMDEDPDVTGQEPSPPDPAPPPVQQPRWNFGVDPTVKVGNKEAHIEEGNDT